MTLSRWSRTMMILLVAVMNGGRAAALDPIRMPRELSVYHSMYDGRMTACGQRYDHWGKPTAAANDLKCGTRLKVTWGDKSLIVTVNDTGSDPKLGGKRIDLSGYAMKHFRPSWNGKNKNAPLLKGATVEVMK